MTTLANLLLSGIANNVSTQTTQSTQASLLSALLGGQSQSDDSSLASILSLLSPNTQSIDSFSGAPFGHRPPHGFGHGGPRGFGGPGGFGGRGMPDPSQMAARMFSAIDTDGSGDVTRAEFIAHNPPAHPGGNSPTISDEHKSAMFDRLANGAETLTQDAFKRMPPPPPGGPRGFGFGSQAGGLGLLTSLLGNVDNNSLLTNLFGSADTTASTTTTDTSDLSALLNSLLNS